MNEKVCVFNGRLSGPFRILVPKNTCEIKGFEDKDS